MEVSVYLSEMLHAYFLLLTPHKVTQDPREGGGEGEEKKYLKIIEVKNGMLLMVILVGNKGVVTDL